MREGTERKKKRKNTRFFFFPQAPVPGTCSLVLLPCLPSTGVPVPLRLPKSTRQKEKKKRGKTHDFLRPQVPVSGTRPPVPQGKTHDILCPQAPVPGTRSPVLLLCLPSTGVPVPLRLPKSTHQKKNRSCFFPPSWSWREGHSGPAGPGLVSYPLRKALGSCRCGCGLDVVLCPLVSILGIVFFVIFS